MGAHFGGDGERPLSFLVSVRRSNHADMAPFADFVE
jgi:hypothetical protein